MAPGTERPPDRRQTFIAASIIAALLVVAVIFVASSLRRPAVDSYAPTPPDPVDAGVVLVGPRTYTVDASNTEAWAAFDFSRGSAVASRDAGGWDIAFRRFNVMTNGGGGFSGNAGVVDLGAVAFDSVTSAPEAGYVAGNALRDSVNEAIDRWYDYGFTSHILRTKGHVYAIRTADGRYAKLQILSYYCPGALPGCITFRYVYQGSGSRDLSAPAAEPSRSSRPASDSVAPAGG
jgi:hypothetical protein